MAIAITIIAAALILLLSFIILRLWYEKRFRDWCQTEQSRWQAEAELARQKAIEQSRAVLGGKFTEQMVPFFPDFQYDPTEVRFIGSPVDMIVFRGISRGEPEEIVILEIKTGKNAKLTALQRKIRTLVENGKVRWDEVYRVGADT